MRSTFIPSVMIFAMVTLSTPVFAACEGLTKAQCRALAEEMEALAAYLGKKSKEDKGATDKALNKCVARLPVNFTGKQLIDCMAKDIGR